MVAIYATLAYMGEMMDTTIDAHTAYPLPEFARRTGMGRAAVRAARRAGLIVRRCGNRKYVLGSDWLAFLRADARADIPGIGIDAD